MATLQIGGYGIAEWAPGNFQVSVSNGGKGFYATLSIDGTETGQHATLGEDGALGNLTVMLFSRYTVGWHTLDITTVDPEDVGAGVQDSGTFDFEVQRTVPVPTAFSTPPAPAPQQVANRWQFEDPVTSQLYVLPINPATAGVPFSGRNLSNRETTTGRAITTEGNRHSSQWALEGYIENQVQYNALLAWSVKPYRLYITDDFGNQFIGVITNFMPTPLAPNRAGEFFYRGRYQMNIEVMSQTT